MADHVLVETLSEPLNGATTAEIDIDSGTGNLTVDALPGVERVLAAGTLQYGERQGRPSQTVAANQGRATLTVKGRGTGRSWLHFPWAACTGATEWQIHLNPAVASDIRAHTGGGNVKLNLAGLAVSGLVADTGGGNLDVVLPDGGAKVGGAVGQAHVHVAPAGLRREAGDGQAGQVERDVAAIAVGGDVGRDRGSEMDLPLV